MGNVVILKAERRNGFTFSLWVFFMILHCLTQIEDALKKRAEYAISSLFSIAGLSFRFTSHIDGDENAVIHYGSTFSDEYTKMCRGGTLLIHIPCCSYLYGPEWGREEFEGIETSLSYFKDLKTEENVPFWGDVKAQNDTSHMQRSNQPATIEKIGSGALCVFNFDLFANTFFHLSRIEEQRNAERDKWNRFPSSQSLLGRSGLLDRAVIDEHAQALINVIIECCRVTGKILIRKCAWPRGKPFAAFFSHDVDRIRKWTPKRIGYETIRSGRDPLKLKELALSVLSDKDPYWTFDRLLQMEERAGVKSSFYFGVKRRVKSDPSYYINRRDVQELIKKLKKRGCEIGLHGGMTSYRDVSQLKSDKKMLEGISKGEISGVRQHYLRLDYDTTLKSQKIAGFQYDATLGYADCEGFRAGTSFPLHPFDHTQEQQMDFLEIPLSLMDSTLTGYKGYTAQDAFEATQSLLQKAEKNGGLFTFLVHQNSLDKSEFPYIEPLYEHTLMLIQESDAYCATGKGIADWWRDRESLRIIQQQRKGKTLEFFLESEREIPHITITIEPVVDLDSIKIEVDGCNHKEANDALRLQLESVPRNRTVRIKLRRL